MNSDPAGQPMSRPTLADDQVVADTYRIVRRVGAGGMGEIYEATHLRLAGRYAIKLLRPEIAATPDALARFQREAKVTSALRHPNIVQVVDFSTLENGAPFMVMEYLDGLELAGLIRQSGPLPIARVVSQVRQIASGLTAAHENDVVHRDLKPQNIFVLEVVGHEQELLKIVDFGISKVKDVTSTITASSSVMGTVQYMSPEQARGRVEEIDARTDQFALAAIVYEMLTGRDAFTGNSVSSLLYQIVHEEPAGLADANGPIPPAIAAVLRRAFAKDKTERFPTVLAFSVALENAAEAGAAPSANTLPAKPTTLDSAPGERPRAFLLAAALAAAVVVAGFWFMRRERRASVDAGPRPAVAAPVREAAAALAATPRPAKFEDAPDRPPEPEKLRRSTKSARETGLVANRPARTHDGVDLIRHAAPVSQKSAPAAPAPKASSCDPNFFFDAQGDKHFKPECFLN
jgi:tRNA A-37 threonylcarbamoyl transferase component Bud32